jgi:hypothetical protein
MKDPVNVNHVHTNVTPVPTNLNNVTSVLLTESMLQTVTVHQVSMMKKVLKNVKDVLTDVTLVTTALLAWPVMLQELTHHTVCVQMVWWKSVPTKLIFLVTKTVPNQPVLTVTTDVLLVNLLQKIVLSVLLTELMPQDVNVQKVSSITELKSVHNVTTLVELVKITLITVLIVMTTEKIQMKLVHVNTECTNKTESVKTVTTNVNTVNTPLIPVLFALETELMPQFVNVQLTPMKTSLQLVQIVLKNVLSVPTCQTTVSLVLKEEYTHQSVIFQNQTSNLPPLMMYQSVPLELSTVTVDVKLVKESELTV